MSDEVTLDGHTVSRLLTAEVIVMLAYCRVMLLGFANLAIGFCTNQNQQPSTIVTLTHDTPWTLTGRNTNRRDDSCEQA